MAGESMEIAAQIVPSILIGIIGYTSWVITHVVVRKSLSSRHHFAVRPSFKNRTPCTTAYSADLRSVLETGTSSMWISLEESA